MSPLDVLAEPVWQRLTWTLLHFLWQGLAVVVLLEALRRLFSVRRARASYALSLAAMAAIAICPVVTFAVLGTAEIAPAGWPEQAGAAGDALEYGSAPPVAGGPRWPPRPAIDAGLSDQPTVSPATVAWRVDLGRFAGAAQPYLLVAWITGVLLLSSRLLLSLVGMHWLRRSRRPIAAALADRVAGLGRRLGLRSVPTVFLSEKARQAIVVGFLRPVVLLPASWMAETTPEVLEAVIAHELAHIRRWDLWVNLLQRLVETLLFYHPAVWWLSRRLRLEREMCCDELAVAATGQPVVYASALALVARKRPAATPLFASTMGGTKMTLLLRVRYVLGLTPCHERSRWWPVGVLSLLLLVGIWRAAILKPSPLRAETQAQETVDDGESEAIDVGAAAEAADPDETTAAEIADPNRPLYVIDADGRNLRRLVSLPDYTACGSPVWSADGTQIACDAWKLQNGETYSSAHVLVMNSDGSDVKDLGPGALPSWSPGGKRITFSQYSPNQGVWVMYADGSLKKLLDPAGWSSEWSPDGRKLAWVTREGGAANICVYDLIEGDLRLVLDEGHRYYNYIAHSFTWSPDGKRLCFRGERPDDEVELVIVSAEGSSNGFNVRLQQRVVSNIAWSPDGRQILVPIRAKETKTHQLYLVDPNTFDPPVLLKGQPAGRDNMESDWSPDGKTILFAGGLRKAAPKPEPQAPPAEAKPSGSAEKAPGAGKAPPPEIRPAPEPEDTPTLRFSFRYVSWKDVLEWFAEQADLSLVFADQPPSGTFNYSDTRGHTPEEAIQLLQGALLTKGYSLERRGGKLVLSKEKSPRTDAATGDDGKE